MLCSENQGAFFKLKQTMVHRRTVVDTTLLASRCDKPTGYILMDWDDQTGKVCLYLDLFDEGHRTMNISKELFHRCFEID